MNTLEVGKFRIKKNGPIFIIAEGGVNHNGDVDLAKLLCKAARETGADAIKFQTWKTEHLLTNNVKTANYQRTTTKEKSQFNMLKKLELSHNDFREISRYCKKIGIIFLSTPGDKESADFLEDLNVPAFKIGSDDLDNLSLIKHVAQKGKPMIISTGMSTMKEVKETFCFIKKFNQKVAFLHCTSNYPTNIRDVNLNAMLTMKKELKTLIGYSDHTTNIWIPSVAVSLGAKIIEKHLTLDKNMIGPDHASSLDLKDFSRMVNLIRKTEKSLKNKKLIPPQVPNFVHEILRDEIRYEVKIALGSYQKRHTNSEKEVMAVVKKTILAVRSIKKNEKLTEDMLVVMRAGQVGISPREYFNLIGKFVKRKIKRNEVIHYEKLY